MHLFHYADLWADRDRRDADGSPRRSDVAIDEDRWPSFVEAAGIESMRARADDTAPEAHLGLWQSTRAAFFRSGARATGRRCSTPDDLAHFDERLHELAGDATGWVLTGRTALGSRAEPLPTPSR